MSITIKKGKICEFCTFKHDSYDGCCEDCSPEAGYTTFCILNILKDWRETKDTNTCEKFKEEPEPDPIKD